MISTETLASSSVVDDSTESGSRPSYRGVAAALVGIVVVIALVPTLWGAVTSMGWSQWLEALAIGLLFFPAAVGVYITFRVLDFPDLTVDASFPAGGAIAATMISNGVSPWLSLPAAMLLGALLGVVTGVLHIYLRVNSLLASIITLTGAFTVNLRVQGSANISLLDSDRIFTPWLEPIKNQLEGWFGSSGIQVHRAVTTSLMTFFVQHSGFADINSGAGLIVSGLAAVIIGEVLFGSKARGTTALLVAVGLGMVTYRVAIALALNANLRFPGTDGFRLEASDIKLATAAVVVAMLAVPRLRESRDEQMRRRRRRA